jgi:hypothetical protein
VLRDLSNAGFAHILSVTRDVTQGDVGHLLGIGAAKSFKGAALKLFQRTQLPFGTFFVQLTG